ncbi:MAG: hypothetical protein ACEQSU_16615 [Microgenomates group bacterium]
MMGTIGGFAAFFGILCLVAILMVCAAGVCAIMLWAIFAIIRFFFGAG